MDSLMQPAQVLVVSAILTASVPAAPAAAAYEINWGDAITECSFLAQDEGGYVQVSWIPVELWEYSLSREGPLTEEMADLFVKPFRNYVLITVTAMRVGKPGVVEFAAREEIRKTVRLRDRYGKVYEPVKLGTDDPALALFAEIWEKVFAPQFGPVGGATNLFYFPAEDEQGECIASPTKEGKFAVLVGEHEFTWELPLSAFLRPKTCPACGREMSGTYNFCPYDGTELEGQEVTNPPEDVK
jgi:hypothetical protein